MTAAVGALARFGAHLGLALLIGSTVFLFLAGPAPDPHLRRWHQAVRRQAPIAALLFVAGCAIGLLAQAAAILQQPLLALAAQPGVLADFAGATHLGRLSVARLAAGLLLLLALAAAPLPGRAAAVRACSLLLVAAAAVVTGGWSGHAAGAEAAYLLPLQIAHVLAVTLWLGALPAWIGLVRRVAAAPDAARCGYAARTLRRFSRLATACVLVIAASGLGLAWSYIDSQGDLLGTRYGGLLCAKVLLLTGVLLLADRVRRGFLAAMAAPDGAGPRYRGAARLVTAELVLAGTVLLLGATLAQTTPANHAQPYWWLPFRISAAATWPIWSVPGGPYAIGIAVLLVLAALAWLLRAGARTLRTRLQVCGAAVAAAGAVLLWPSSVPAYPDTYRRSEVAYLTVSIAHGQASYEAHCVACHGGGGLGDGPAGRQLPRPPANLSQPHTALHTAGDMYWWLGHGIPRSGMPGFAAVLSDEDRWDLVNFLRAFSQGFQARILSPRAVPMAPWLGAPDFYFETADGAPHELKEFRGRSAVLLAFLAGGDSGAAVERVARGAAAAGWPGLVVLAVADTAAAGPAPYTLISTGAAEIRGSYELLSRTAANRGDPQRIGLPRAGMAFLIDRYGYIRARWIPEEEAGAWDDPGALGAQVSALNAEPQLLPSPDDHVH